MVLAAVGDNLYNLFFLAHMVALVVAFAPAVIHPILAAQVQKDGEQTLLHVAAHLAENGRRVHFPALIALGGFGLAMVFTSDEAWGFDQTWAMAAVTLWIVMCGLISGVLLPSERKFAAGDMEAEKKIAMTGQLVSILAMVMLYLMIWKPGL